MSYGFINNTSSVVSGGGPTSFQSPSSAGGVGSGPAGVEYSAAALYGVRSSAPKFTQPDQWGTALLSLANPEDQQTLDWSQVPRQYWGGAVMKTMMNHSILLTTEHLSVDNIMTHRQAAWHEHRIVGAVCPVFTLAVWAVGDAGLKRRAVFLRFLPLHLQDEKALKLEHFLRWPGGRPRTITTLRDLEDAMKGVGLWVEFILGSPWAGLLRGFFVDVDEHRFDGYAMAYVLIHVYAALHSFVTVALRAKTLPDTPPLQLRDELAEVFASIKDRLNALEYWTFGLSTGTMGTLGLPTSFGEPALPAAPHTPVSSASRSLSTLTSTSSGSSAPNGVCFLDLAERYGFSGAQCSGSCSRLHFRDLKAGTTRTGLITMLEHLRAGPMRVAILDGIAADKELSA
jgi:hypothetical protein